MSDAGRSGIAGLVLGLVALAALLMDQVPATWAQTSSPSDRFTLVMGGEAVKDNKTGLLW